MCDTMVALGTTTRSGFSLFAKNSDRCPNEPQYYAYIPAEDHAKGSKVKCTYIKVKQVPHTYAVILSKPSWIWGGEMGFNEHGVVIGNEAVWTKEPYGKPALLGMDILRLGLERGATAKEATYIMRDLLVEYAQGGNCNFEGEGTYHNAFLTSDASEAYVLETAGEYWAIEQVKDYRTISNTMSVSNYDDIHSGAIAHAIEQGYCKSEDDFDFARTFLDWDNPVYMSGSMRSCMTRNVLEGSRGAIDELTMRTALRSHNNVDYFTHGAVGSPCMHADGSDGSCQSTASIIAQIRENGRSLYFGTNMSTPCLAPFKPFWFDAYANDMVYAYDKLEEARVAWVRREGINRAAVAGKLDLAGYRAELFELEAKWLRDAKLLDRGPQPERKGLCDAISLEENAFVEKWLKASESACAKPFGGEVYKGGWAGWNERLGQDTRIAY